MTQDTQGPVHAPELEGGEWLQGGPVPIRGRGKPVLIDFGLARSAESSMRSSKV